MATGTRLMLKQELRLVAGGWWYPLGLVYKKNADAVKPFMVSQQLHVPLICDWSSWKGFLMSNFFDCACKAPPRSGVTAAA